MEEFIERHQEQVNWEIVSQYQVLSEEFIWKWIKKLNLKEVIRHQKLSHDFLKQLIEILLEEKNNETSE